MNLPKREELSFLTVLALPQASSTGLVATILSSRDASPSFLLPEEQMVAKYEMTFFGVLSLSSTRFTSNEDRLVNTRVAHALISSLGNGKNMRPALVTPLTNIQLHGAQGCPAKLPRQWQKYEASTRYASYQHTAPWCAGVP